MIPIIAAGWSSLVARKAHNLEVPGSNPGPATKIEGVSTTPFLFATFKDERGNLTSAPVDGRSLPRKISRRRSSNRLERSKSGPTG